MYQPYSIWSKTHLHQTRIGKSSANRDCKKVWLLTFAIPSPRVPSGPVFPIRCISPETIFFMWCFSLSKSQTIWYHKHLQPRHLLKKSRFLYWEERSTHLYHLQKVASKSTFVGRQHYDMIIFTKYLEPTKSKLWILVNQDLSKKVTCSIDRLHLSCLFCSRNPRPSRNPIMLDYRYSKQESKNRRLTNSTPTISQTPFRRIARGPPESPLQVSVSLPSSS